MSDLILRRVEIGGRHIADVRIRNGLIEAIGDRLDRHHCDEIDGNGGALLPGLIDHHLHLFGIAAAWESVEASPLRTPDARTFRAAVAAAEGRLEPGNWLRIIGYDDSVAGRMDRDVLDRLAPHRPTKLQYRTGGLWVLNSAALALLPSTSNLPAGVERGDEDRLTGRVFREDRWMREVFPAQPPSLTPVAQALTAYGIAAVTDASVTMDDNTAKALIAEAHRSGFKQRLTLMSGEHLGPSPDGAFGIGPVKVLLDDDRLGDPSDMARTIRQARDWHRTVAVHCVTAGELAYALAAFDEAGARPGDRIEHGGMIDDDAADRIVTLGLTVVTQPGFVLDRGDRYLNQVPPQDQAHLYRIAGLQRRGVHVAGSSDGPYATLDPWASMRAAVNRRTRNGQILGPNEGVAPAHALALYLGSATDPGGPPRRIEVGAPADLCLMHRPLAEVLEHLSSDLVARTLIGGVA